MAAATEATTCLELFLGVPTHAGTKRRTEEERIGGHKRVKRCGEFRPRIYPMPTGVRSQGCIEADLYCVSTVLGKRRSEVLDCEAGLKVRVLCGKRLWFVEENDEIVEESVTRSSSPARILKPCSPRLSIFIRRNIRRQNKTTFRLGLRQLVVDTTAVVPLAIQEKEPETLEGAIPEEAMVPIEGPLKEVEDKEESSEEETQPVELEQTPASPATETIEAPVAEEEEGETPSPITETKSFAPSKIGSLKKFISAVSKAKSTVKRWKHKKEEKVKKVEEKPKPRKRRSSKTKIVEELNYDDEVVQNNKSSSPDEEDIPSSPKDAEMGDNITAVEEDGGSESSSDESEDEKPRKVAKKKTSRSEDEEEEKPKKKKKRAVLESLSEEEETKKPSTNYETASFKDIDMMSIIEDNGIEPLAESMDIEDGLDPGTSDKHESDRDDATSATASKSSGDDDAASSSSSNEKSDARDETPDDAEETTVNRPTDKETDGDSRPPVLSKSKLSITITTTRVPSDVLTPPPTPPLTPTSKDSDVDNITLSPSSLRSRLSALFSATLSRTGHPKFNPLNISRHAYRDRDDDEETEFEFFLHAADGPPSPSPFLSATDFCTLQAGPLESCVEGLERFTMAC